MKTLLGDNRMITLAALWTSLFVVNANIILILPLLPFLRPEFGLSGAESATVLIAYPVLAFAANILLGPFIDKYGPRRFLLIGSIGCAATFLLMGLAENTYLIILWRAAAGFFTPMMGASVFAAVADYYPEKERPVIVGYVSSAPAVAPMVIMPLAILAAAEFSWRVPLFGLAVVSLVVAGAVWMIGDAEFSNREQRKITPKIYAEKYTSFAINRKIFFGLFSFIIVMIAIFEFMALYPDWLWEHAAALDQSSGISMIFLIGGVLGVLGAMLSGNLAKKLGGTKGILIASSLVTGIVTLFAAGASETLVIQIVVFSIFSFGRAMIMPLLISSLMQEVAATERGSMNGFINAAFQIGVAAGSLIGGISYAGDSSYFLTASISVVLFVFAATIIAFEYQRAQLN